MSSGNCRHQELVRRRMPDLPQSRKPVGDLDLNKLGLLGGNRAFQRLEFTGRISPGYHLYLSEHQTSRRVTRRACDDVGIRNQATV